MKVLCFFIKILCNFFGSIEKLTQCLVRQDKKMVVLL